MDLQLEVVVDPKISGVVEGAISFETGLTRAQAADPTLYAYEHHGDEFAQVDPGALTCFYEDLILGRPLPTRFATCSLQGPDTLVAISLFLHRDLATHPAMPGLVASVDLAHRRGPQGLAHLDDEATRLVLLLSESFSTDAVSPTAEQGQRLKTVTGWVYNFISQQGGLPWGPPIPQPRILDAGTNGFVIAELAQGPLVLGWVRLYRDGYLRGLLLGPAGDGRRLVLASRKSVFVPFNLTKAASLLNEVELAMGQPGTWKADELWLYSPRSGSAIELQHLTAIFLRV